VSAPRPIDTLHLGHDRVIACWEFDGVLVDPGPESTFANVLAGLGEGFEPRALLLTHIHLDHAGATGAIVRRWPGLPVYVHERGIKHMADPSRLIDSAAQLYGDRMDALWGEIVPVPERNLNALSGGETVEGCRVEYTPGHASHHVSYLHEASGTAFVGDVAGVIIPPASLVVPPTPPPDIDVERWNDSISLVSQWNPEQLALTHYGPVADVQRHLAEMRDRLAARATLAKTLDQAGFIDAIEEEVRAAAPDPETAEAYNQAAIPEHLWAGLERYWRKRAEREAG
jgi:glyoxylase-like metal-dependent hydrolase (beta-lactamase superfamily II)